MFKFRFRRNQTTEENKEFVDREVKKIPKAVTTIFLVYILIFLSLIIWYFTFKSTYYISTVKGSSMKPTINGTITNEDQTEDFVYVNTKSTPERGDIVVIETIGDPIIKRVIGMEGDKVSIVVGEDGFYHINIQYVWAEESIVLEEDYIKSYSEWKNVGYYTETIYDSGNVYEKAFYNMFIKTNGFYDENVSVIDGVYYYEIPEDSYFCLGDNRAVSSDSRAKGTFDKSKIKGVADIIVRWGSVDKGWLFGKKVSAIFSFYWDEIENLFAR